MRVQVGDVRLFFDVEGAGLVVDGPSMRQRAALVLLPGGPGFSHTVFRPAFSQLADVAQVVYLDPRGHGRSDRGDPARWTVGVWADDVSGFCDAVGIEHPVVLGWSFGETVAMAYATRHPGHPAKLVLQPTTGGLEIDRVVEAFRRLGGRRGHRGSPGPLVGRGSEILAAYGKVCASSTAPARPTPTRWPALFNPELPSPAA